MDAFLDRGFTRFSLVVDPSPYEVTPQNSLASDPAALSQLLTSRFDLTLTNHNLYRVGFDYTLFADPITTLPQALAFAIANANGTAPAVCKALMRTDVVVVSGSTQFLSSLFANVSYALEYAAANPALCAQHPIGSPYLSAPIATAYAVVSNNVPS